MMEGTLEPDLGFVIALVGLEDQHIRPGRIEYETGQVEVLVKFTVMLFRPFRNEILDAQVTTVTEMGFFADAGPVQGIYVNKHQMPQDYGFDAQDNVWRTSDMEVEIRPGCGVRMRVVGVDITPGRMVRYRERRRGWGFACGFDLGKVMFFGEVLLWNRVSAQNVSSFS